MPYVIDRRRALRCADIVAVVSGRRRGARSVVILADNSLHSTLTRPQTLVRRANGRGVAAPQQRGGRKTRTTWRLPP